MNLPRVLHVSTIPQWGGGEQQLIYLYEELAQREVEQLIVCCQGSKLHEYCVRQGIPFKALKKAGSVSVRYVWQLHQMVKAFKPTVIHVHDSRAHMAAVLHNSLFYPLISTVVSRKVVYSVRDTLMNRFKYNHRSVKRVLCVSNAVREQVLPVLQDKEKAVIVHDSVYLDVIKVLKNDGSFRAEHDIDCNTVLIGTVGSLEPVKNHKQFIDMVRLLKARGIQAKYMIMGGGSLRDELIAYAKAQSVEDELIFAGFCKDVRKAMQELDLFVLTSRSEGLSHSTMIAMAVGTPVIATCVGGVPELIDHEQTGLLVRVDDAEGLSEAVENLLCNPELRAACIKAAREKISAFDRPIMAEKTLACY